MPYSEEFNSLVYPIPGFIRWEIKDPDPEKLDLVSDRVKVGGSEWCLLFQKEQQHLGVSLMCCSEIIEGKTLKVNNVIRLLEPEEYFSNMGLVEFSHTNNTWGDVSFLEWSELEKYGKVVVQCDFSIIDSEDSVIRRVIDFYQERPNTDDRKVIFEPKKNLGLLTFSEEIEISDLSSDIHRTKVDRICNLPVQLCFKKFNKGSSTWLGVYLELNKNDKSEWWICETFSYFAIVNQKEHPDFKQLFHGLHHLDNIARGWREFIEWKTLVDPANGYVENDAFIIKATVQITAMHGFDEKTGLGIDVPRPKMTTMGVQCPDGRFVHCSQQIMLERSKFMRDKKTSGNVDPFEVMLTSVTPKFLVLAHGMDPIIDETNVLALAKMIKEFEAPECFEMMDSILCKQTWTNFTVALELVDEFPFPHFKRKILMILRKDEDAYNLVRSTGSYEKLSEGLRKEVRKIRSKLFVFDELEPLGVQFHTDFTRKTELFDVEIQVENSNFYAGKQVLAHFSHYFMKLFFHPCARDDKKRFKYPQESLMSSLFLAPTIIQLSYIRLHNNTSDEILMLLDHIYHPTRPVTIDNVGKLFQLADQFSVPRITEKCEEWLVLTDKVSLIDKLEFGAKYKLPYVLPACLKKMSSLSVISGIINHEKFQDLASNFRSAVEKRKVEIEEQEKKARLQIQLISKTFEKQVYPIRGKIRFEVKNIHILECKTFSNEGKIGKCFWRLEAKTTTFDNEKWLGIFLSCCSYLEKERKQTADYVFHLKHPLDAKKNKTANGTEDFKQFGRSSGHSKFIKLSEIVSQGFEVDGKIILECELSIASENEVKRRTIDFLRKRPNEQDLEDILGANKTIQWEKHEEDVDLASISRDEQYLDQFSVSGIPVEIGIQKTHVNNEDFLSLSIHLNWNDQSEWWRCQTAVEIRILNQKNREKFHSFSFFHLYQKTKTVKKLETFLKWSDLVHFSNGYIKAGKFKIQVFVQVLKTCGFDEHTNKGIDAPFRMLSDATLIVDRRLFYVSRQILIQQSTFFIELFRANNEQPEVEDVNSEDFVRFLEVAYNMNSDISEDNAEGVLALCEKFQASECFARIDILLRGLEFKDDMKALEWIDKYGLIELKEKLHLKLAANEQLFNTITHSPRFENLSPKFQNEILKRKFTSTTHNFHTNFQEESDFTDVRITVADSYSFYATKQILANSSIFFLNKFYSPYSDDLREVPVFDVSPENFETLLTHIYHPIRSVTDKNLPVLLQLAYQFSVPRLMDKCEEFLVLTDDVQLVDKLEYAKKYDLPYLTSSTLKATGEQSSLNANVFI